MDRIRLEPVREDEIPQMYEMQIESFMPLYEKYHDAGSPAVESIEKVRARAAVPWRKYYFIVRDGERVGAVNISCPPGLNDKTIFYISPLFIVPRCQNQGIGYAAIQKVFALHPEASCWRLDTILQEPGNCHLYEKCGFIRTGGEHVINDAMTLIGYELKRQPEAHKIHGGVKMKRNIKDEEK